MAGTGVGLLWRWRPPGLPRWRPCLVGVVGFGDAVVYVPESPVLRRPASRAEGRPSLGLGMLPVPPQTCVEVSLAFSFLSFLSRGVCMTPLCTERQSGDGSITSQEVAVKPCAPRLWVPPRMGVHPRLQHLRSRPC